MEIGLLTNSLVEVGLKDIEEVAKWTTKNGIHHLEVGPTIEQNQKSFEKVIENGSKINAFIYCRNFLSSNEEEALMHQNELKNRIEMAGKIGTKKVVCSTGNLEASHTGMSYSPEKSLSAFFEVFKPIVDLAAKKDVKICFENCPVMGNIAISPEVYEEIFKEFKTKSVGMCYDPSHLVWQGIDPYRFLNQFKDKIYHVHAKDTEIDKEMLYKHGVLDNKRWWRHRLPGLGEINFTKIIDLLYQAEYNDIISIEHEDPVWGGTKEKVMEGIIRSKDFLNKYI